MVVFLIAVAKGKTTKTSREFSGNLKRIFEKEKVEPKKVNPIELSTLNSLISSSLDGLLKINDDLIKDDNEIEMFLKALEKKIKELDPNATLSVAIKGKQESVENAISVFSWDENKFPKNQKTIEEILNKIREKFNATRQNLKVKQDEFNLESEQLKQKKRVNDEALTLMKKDYRDLVNACKQKMITTEYLSTVLCFVPKAQNDLFLKNYTHLAGGLVLPYSAERLDLGEDDKIYLYRVVVMTHVKDDFRNQCLSSFRVQCRNYDEEEINRKPAEVHEIQAMEQKLRTKKQNLIRNAISGFSEVFSALLHLKYLRLYVEASLKYGNNDYFSSVIFVPLNKEQKAVKVLINAFNDTSDKEWYGTKEDLKESEDFYPFILIKLGCPSTITG